MDTNKVGRSNTEPKNIYDILAQIMDDLRAGKDHNESNGKQRKGY